MRNLFQVVKQYKGTNAEYFLNEDLEKIKTGGAEFVIIDETQKRRFECDNNVYLYERSDGSLSQSQMMAIVKDNRGTMFGAMNKPARSNKKYSSRLFR